MRRRAFGYGAASAALMVFACVDGASGPGTHRPVNLDVQVTLPVATPPAWSPVGESLYVSIRRAGRVEPIAETTLVVTEALAATLRVPLSYATERFVASAEVRYAGALLFLAFESAELREGSDTTVSLAAQYVGPGARTATFELLASDSSLAPQDTARLIRLARDSSGLEIPNVPARFVAARIEVVTVDTAGLLTAVGNAADTARVTGYLPTGHSSGMVVQVVDTTTPPPPPPVPVVTTVSVSPPAATLTAAGQFTAYTATALDQNGSAMPEVAFTWASSNGAVASIDQEGVATAVGAGSTLITATADGVAGSAMLTVTITPPDDPSLTRSWIGGDAAGAGPNDWSNAANWSPAGVPRSGDSVVIAASANDPMLTAAVTIARLRIIGGSLTVNGRSLTVTGDLSTENDAGAIRMMQATDTVRVLGNAVFAGSETSAFEDGALFVGGTFEQRALGDGSASFRAGFAHTTVLNGSAQQLILMHTEIQFGRLEISNTGGVRVDPAVDLETEIEIERGLRITTPVVVDVQGVMLDVEDSLVTVAGSRLTGARVRLAGGMAVAGTFDPDLVQFSGEGHGIQARTYTNVEVEDSVHLRGPTTITGSLTIIHNGHLTMNGQSLSVATLDVGGSADQGLREAYLTMDNAADVLTVSGDAVFDSDTSGTMSAGTLFVAGSLRIQRARSFTATGSHRIAVTGAAAQQLRIAEGARLSTLDILNAVGPLTIISPSEEAGLVRLNGKLAIRNPIVVESSAAAFDVADSVIAIAGSSLTVGGLILRGAIALDGAFTTGRMEFAGMNQDVPAHGVYDGEVTVSGAARLVAATTFSDFTFIHGPQAVLTLNGQRLSSGSFSAGTLDEPTGALIMTSAADSLVVAGNVVFAATSTAGQLTAGTIVAGGGLFTGDEPGAFQPSGSHKVVLNGAQQQILQISATAALSGFNHLELANTSGGIWLRTPITVAGTLRTSTVDQVISGTGHHLLTVGGVDVNRLTLDTIPLAIQSGALTRLDSVTFSRQNRTATQLSIAHAGAVAPFTFRGLQFLSTPTTGLYVSANDVASGDGNVLTIQLTQSTPDDGSARTQTSGGAIVRWDGGFTATGTMIGARLSHAAALLNDGRVLVAGGRSGPGAITGANIYTPASGTFVSTGSMNRGRFDFAMSTLADGRVFVAGGDATSPMNATETFDPSSGTFTIPDTLGANPGCQGRIAPTATRLLDGRVLIAGGAGRATPNLVNACWPVISEIFDPVTNTIIETGVLVVGRFRHTATLLTDGRVLIAGGWDATNDVTAVSEIFNPAAGTFTQAASLAVARASHTATRLNDGRVLIAGGDLAAVDQTAVEIYDPSTNTYSATGSLSAYRSGHLAFPLPDGRVLLAGGNGPDGLHTTYEIYDPATGTFSPPAPLVATRWLSAGLVLLDGRILITGGSSLTGAGSNTAEVFQP